MPIYEYECEICGFKFDLLGKLGGSAEVTCPKCNRQSRRIYSSVPMIFKGSRWVGGKKQKQDNQTELKADNTTKVDKKTEKASKKKNTD